MGWGALAAIGDTANTIGGTIWSANQSSKEARRQRKWAEKMSSTAYQRGMEDMRLAGLNPILAYKQGGASSPTGSMAPMPNMGAALASTAGSVTRGIESASKVAKMGPETKAINANVGYTNAQTAVAAEEQRNKVTAREVMKIQGNLYEAQREQAINNARQAQATAKMVELGLPAAEARFDVDNTWIGQKAIQANRLLEPIDPLIAAGLGYVGGKARVPKAPKPRYRKGAGEPSGGVMHIPGKRSYNDYDRRRNRKPWKK